MEIPWCFPFQKWSNDAGVSMSFQFFFGCLLDGKLWKAWKSILGALLQKIGLPQWGDVQAIGSPKAESHWSCQVGVSIVIVPQSLDGFRMKNPVFKWMISGDPHGRVQPHFDYPSRDIHRFMRNVKTWHRSKFGNSRPLQLRSWTDHYDWFTTLWLLLLLHHSSSITRIVIIL